MAGMALPYLKLLIYEARSHKSRKRVNAKINAYFQKKSNLNDE